MSAETFRDLLVGFIKKLFSTGDDVSSKRLLGFYFALVVTFLMFFNYDYEVISAVLILIAALMGLTTVEKFKK